MSSIKDFDLWRLEAPLGRIIGDNNCSYSSINVIALRLRTEAGHVGWGYGECCHKGTFKRPAWYIHPMVSEPMLRNDFERAWWPLLNQGDPTGSQIEEARKNHASQHSYLDAAVRMALWDLLAQVHELPLYQLISSSSHTNDVMAYGSILDYPLNETEAISLAQGFARQGFRAIKVKVGAPDVERDIQRLQAVRVAVGNEVELTADANEEWTCDIALARLQAYADAGITLGYIEDPLPHTDISGLQQLTAEAPIPVVGHDYIHTVEEVRELLEQRAVKQLRVGKDLDFTLQCAAMARSYDVPLIMGNSLFEFNVHAAVAFPNVGRLEFSDLAWNDLIVNPVHFEDGRAHAPECPGHGLVPNMAVLQEWSQPDSEQ